MASKNATIKKKDTKKAVKKTAKKTGGKKKPSSTSGSNPTTQLPPHP